MQAIAHVLNRTLIVKPLHISKHDTIGPTRPLQTFWNIDALKCYVSVVESHSIDVPALSSVVARLVWASAQCVWNSIIRIVFLGGRAPSMYCFKSTCIERKKSFGFSNHRFPGTIRNQELLSTR